MHVDCTSTPRAMIKKKVRAGCVVTLNCVSENLEKRRGPLHLSASIHPVDSDIHHRKGIPTPEGELAHRIRAKTQVPAWENSECNLCFFFVFFFNLLTVLGDEYQVEAGPKTNASSSVEVRQIY